MTEPWRIEMLGWLRVTRPDRSITRFRSRQHAGLLAYLAYHSERSHPREALVELLWPETDPPVGRHRLCQALYSLRQQLEPPPTPPGAAFQADRHSLRLNPAACVTDVARFEAAIREAGQATGPDERARWLLEAVESYRGELLPGFFEAWIVPERQRLAESHWHALNELRAVREAAGDLVGALPWARQAVAVDPLREESQRELLRLLVFTGQVSTAQRQYAEYADRVQAELGAAPDPSLQALLQAPAGCAASATQPPRSPATGDRRPPPTSQPATAPASTAGPTPAGLAAVFPAPGRGSLPLEFTRFFGREPEIAALAELLRSPEVRLVTLTGPGGVGKTRLALQTARRLRERFSEAVWFAPLVDLADPRLIGDKLLDALRLPRSPNIEPLEQVATFLARQPAFLVLDNLEHLVNEGAPVVQTLLERVETLTCLVTSRQCLNLPAEREFPVAPLPAPNLPAPDPDRARRKAEQEYEHEHEHDLPTVLLLLPSVQLFVDRAQAVQPDFQVTPANAAAVAALCARLEGLPLAIELAAARTRMLTVRQMLARLEQRFELLVSRQRQADPRHQSLRAALDWSYHLLSLELQRFFARLSVFRGGWTLEAAEAVCAAPAALEYLEELRECSLVVAVDGGEEMRYRFLETLREYGLERLNVDGELTTLQRRHAEYFLALAERSEREWHSSAKWEAVDRLEGEHDNVRAALGWSLAQPEGAELGLRLAGAMWGLWHQRGYLAEGVEWLDRALSCNEGLGRTRARAQAFYALGRLNHRTGDHAREYAQLAESEAIWRKLGDQRHLAFALIFLALSLSGRGELERVPALQDEADQILRCEGDRSELAVALFVQGLTLVDRDRPRARTLYEESLKLYREEGDRWGSAYPLALLGNIALMDGELTAARGYLEESLSIVRAAGDTWRVAVDLRMLAEVVIRQGDCSRAAALCEEGLELSRCMGSRAAMSVNLVQLGQVVQTRGEYERARRLFEQSLALQRELRNEEQIAWVLGRLGYCAYMEGDLARAQSLLEESLGGLHDDHDRYWSLALLAPIVAARGDFAAAEARLEESLAYFRQKNHQHALIHSLVRLGWLSMHRGDWQRAAGQFAESLAIRRRLGDRLGIEGCLEGLAAVAVAARRFERAARLFGAAKALREAAQTPLPPVERREFERYLATLRTALGETAFAAAWAAGRAMTLEAAIAAAEGKAFPRDEEGSEELRHA